MSNILYTWEFKDEKNRGSFWYIIALSVVIGIAIRGFLTKQYGMSFIVLLIAGLTYFVENNSDETVQVAIKELGISLSGSFYDYSKISGYSYVYQGETPVYLRLFLKKQSIRVLDIQVNQQILDNIQTILPNLMEENAKQDISFVEKLIKTLKL